MSSEFPSTPPARGEKIQYQDGKLVVPDNPIIPFIEGDGTGPDIWRASRRVFDAAVETAYGGRRRIGWIEVLAGEKAKNATGEWLPEATLRRHRRVLGRHQGAADDAGRRRHPQPERHPAAGARPLRLRAPGALFRRRALAGEASREAGRRHLPREHRGRLRRHRVGAGHARGARIIEFLERPDGRKRSAPTPASGSSPSRCSRSKRLVRKAIQYALDNGKTVVTLVHKGNIMKFTEGAFRDWGYEVPARNSATSRSPRTRSTGTTAGRSPRAR